MSDEATVVVGEDSQSVEGQDSEKTGCASLMPKCLCAFSSSGEFSVVRVVKCGLDRWFKRTGLKACKRTHYCRDKERTARIGCVLHYQQSSV